MKMEQTTVSAVSVKRSASLNGFHRVMIKPSSQMTVNFGFTPKVVYPDFLRADVCSFSDCSNDPRLIYVWFGQVQNLFGQAVLQTLCQAEQTQKRSQCQALERQRWLQQASTRHVTSILPQQAPVSLQLIDLLFHFFGFILKVHEVLQDKHKIMQSVRSMSMHSLSRFQFCMQRAK